MTIELPSNYDYDSCWRHTFKLSLQNNSLLVNISSFRWLM